MRGLSEKGAAIMWGAKGKVKDKEYNVLIGDKDGSN
jgi:hypothetical protein